jgi:homospermidine synthase
MLLKHVRVPLNRITVIDLESRSALLEPWSGSNGVRFIQERVTPANLPRLLSSSVGRGGLIIDLTWSIDFFDIVEWAHNNEVLYVNASLESWDPGAELHSKRLIDKAMYPRYVRAQELAAEWTGRTTAVIDHGSNPGLISAFVKKGLLDIGGRLIGDPETPASDRERIERLLQQQDFALLAKELDVRVIHCSERDSQTPLNTKSADEFVGTWSIEGMWEESVAPCELGWGTHERTRPDSSVMAEYGP